MIKKIFTVFIDKILIRFPLIFSFYNFLIRFLLNRKKNKPLKFVICPLCGKKTIILIERKKLRETGICLFCSANSRYKAVAEILKKVIVIKVLCKNLNFDILKTNINKNINLSKYPLKSFLTMKFLRNFYIYEPSSIGAIYNTLKKYRNFIFSEYFTFPRVKPGQFHGKTQFQDLHSLTFKDESFDLVLTLDVFEHIRDPIIAFKEVYRVLKPNGIHVFTVPLEKRQITIKRLDKNDKILIKPIVYHSDNISRTGTKVYTDFGYDITQAINKYGFSSFIITLKNSNLGIIDSVEIIISLKK